MKARLRSEHSLAKARNSRRRLVFHARIDDRSQYRAACQMSTGCWYLPPPVSCLRVDYETRAELAALARGRALIIDYFAYAARWGLRFGDVRFRWLNWSDPLPDRALLLADIDEPTTFIKADLAPLMLRERAMLRMAGPRWPEGLRRPTIAIADGGPWLAFFEARARPFGLGR